MALVNCRECGKEVSNQAKRLETLAAARANEKRRGLPGPS
jgi:hypothetical protein